MREGTWKEESDVAPVTAEDIKKSMDAAVKKFHDHLICLEKEVNELETTKNNLVKDIANAYAEKEKSLEVICKELTQSKEGLSLEIVKHQEAVKDLAQERVDFEKEKKEVSDYQQSKERAEHDALDKLKVKDEQMSHRKKELDEYKNYLDSRTESLNTLELNLKSLQNLLNEQKNNQTVQQSKLDQKEAEQIGLNELLNTLKEIADKTFKDAQEYLDKAKKTLDEAEVVKAENTSKQKQLNDASERANQRDKDLDVKENRLQEQANQNQIDADFNQAVKVKLQKLERQLKEIREQ